jgi:RNA polymerase sigma factor (sigma-70 family)
VYHTPWQYTIEAQDIAQEASLQAFLGLARLREPARFASWFHAIAANLARSAQRRHHEFSLHTLSDDATIQMIWIDAPPTIEEYQTEKEISETFLLALQHLSDVNRQAVIGFYLQGYNYEELAQILGVPISTVKGRLFQGRQQLKTLLRPLADTYLQPTKRKQRKEQKMTASDLVALQLDSFRTLIPTLQHAVILRDPLTQRGMPILLTASEAKALQEAFHTWKDANGQPYPQDLSQRLLESFGAQLQRVVINALAGQTLYATVTMTQETQTREVDMRLSEALILAVRMGAPIFITHALFDTATKLDLTIQASTFPIEELEARIKGTQALSREERLQLEEIVLTTGVAIKRGNLDNLAESLWAFLLENLTGTREGISLTELRALDVAAIFPTREVIWDDQPMVAIHLPHQQETAWILVQPSVWEKITEPLHHLQRPEQSEEQTPDVAQPIPDGKPLPDVLPPEIQQQIEESLALLIEEPQLRTAILLNSHGTPVAWKGADTQDTVQRFSSKHFNNRYERPANEQNLHRQLGQQQQQIAPASFRKKVVRQELPKEAGGVMGVGVHPGGWQMVVIFAEKVNWRDLKKETRQHLQEAGQKLEAILSSFSGATIKRTGPGGHRLPWNWIKEQFPAQLHLTVEQMKAEVQAGKNVQEIAAAQGISAQQLYDIETQIYHEANTRWLQQGQISQQGFDENAQRFQTVPQAAVNEQITSFYKS